MTAFRPATLPLTTREAVSGILIAQKLTKPPPRKSRKPKERAIKEAAASEVTTSPKDREPRSKRQLDHTVRSVAASRFQADLVVPGRPRGLAHSQGNVRGHLCGSRRRSLSVGLATCGLARVSQRSPSPIGRLVDFRTGDLAPDCSKVVLIATSSGSLWNRASSDLPPTELRPAQPSTEAGRRNLGLR